MEYKSKGYVFDSEVTAWLDRLKELYGSYNKGLRLVAFERGPEMAGSLTDAVMENRGKSHDRRTGKASTVRGPLLKPSERKAAARVTEGSSKKWT